MTCQTVLIHLKDPRAGLLEMLRVLKPGGTLLASEPNNFANRAIGSSLSKDGSVDDMISRLRFGLILERGKQAMGLGFNSVGDFVPGYLAELGTENIQVYLSDKASPYFAPYSTCEQQVNIQQIKDWTERGFPGFDRNDALGFYLAGGGCEADFIRGWEDCLRHDRATVKAIEDGTFHSAGGGVSYLIAARKPLIR